MSLTPEQQAITELRGLQVLTACPGAGKTTVVGRRLVLLVQEAEKMGGGGVAAITFTNAAAEEIRKVYRSITGHALAAPHFVGTIDSFFLQYVFHPFGHFALGDASKPAELIPPHSGLLNFLYRGNAYTALHKVRDKAGYTFQASGEIIASDTQKPDIKAAVKKMKDDMKARNLATVSDAAYWTLVTLRTKKQCCRALIRRFPFIMIDEAQDCSDVQMAIVDELVEQGHKEIMLIGDVFQAIYEFRRAEPMLLQAKVDQQGWTSHTLASSHRCRPEIVEFINRTAVPDDPAFRLITAARNDCQGLIQVLDGNTPAEIAQAYMQACEAQGITPTEASAAILYGSHGSAMSRARITRMDVQGLFAMKQRELHASLPTVLRYRLLGLNAEALREAMELVYQLRFGKSSHEAERDGEDCEAIEAMRPVIWKFCKSLPSHELPLEEWVKETNKLLPALLSAIGASSTFTIVISQRKKAEKTQLLRSLVVGDSDYATGLPLTVKNIHQVKGCTFEAVLLYLDNGAKAVTGKKLVNLLQAKRKFEKMTENDRCIYVGITRPEKLLCFAGDTEALRQLLAVVEAAKVKAKPTAVAKQPGLKFLDEPEPALAPLA